MKKFVASLLVLIVVGAEAQVPNKLSAADKVYGLSKFWQEVNYNFIYLDKVNRNEWDNMYKDLIIKVQQTPDDYQYYRELQRFCAYLKDGHTNIYFPKSIETMNTMFGDYRLFLENIGNKAIVVRTNTSKKAEVPVGSEVIEVNGKPTEQYIIENVAPYISSSTAYVLKDGAVSRLLEGLEGDTFNIKLRTPQQKIISLHLVHKKTNEESVYPEFEKRELLDFKWYDNQLAYVSLNSFDDPKIDTLFIQKLPELYKAKGLVIDLRYNGGGNTDIGTVILQYLTNDKLLYGAKSISRLHVPTFKAWGRFAKAADTLNDERSKKSLLSYLDKNYYYFDYSPDTVELTAPRLVVPTVILLGHRTASAAEDFLIYADNQSHMIKMGERSFGSTGQPYMFDLVGGGSVRICTKKDIYPDGREFVGYGIKPDIEVIPTLEDYLHKKDPVLEKAISYLKEKVK
ncbi:MAG: S41 family peptidase [Ferruginibacter sp.]